jgi:hypothetical protein
MPRSIRALRSGMVIQIRRTVPGVSAKITDPDTGAVLGADKSGMLWITFAAVPTMTDEAAIALLSPLKDFIADLSLARTAIGDQTLAAIGAMYVVTNRMVRKRGGIDITWAA